MSRMADYCIELAEKVADLTGLPFDPVLHVINSGAFPLDMPPRRLAAKVRAAALAEMLFDDMTRRGMYSPRRPA